MTTKLILYSRRGCSLCEQVLEQVLPMVRGKATVSVIDIDFETDIRQEFDSRIPVLADGERIVMEGQFDRQALIHWLVSRQA